MKETHPSGFLFRYGGVSGPVVFNPSGLVVILFLAVFRNIRTGVRPEIFTSQNIFRLKFELIHFWDTTLNYTYLLIRYTSRHCGRRIIEIEVLLRCPSPIQRLVLVLGKIAVVRAWFRFRQVPGSVRVLRFK